MVSEYIYTKNPEVVARAVVERDASMLRALLLISDQRRSENRWDREGFSFTTYPPVLNFQHAGFWREALLVLMVLIRFYVGRSYGSITTRFLDHLLAQQSSFPL